MESLSWKSDLTLNWWFPSSIEIIRCETLFYYVSFCNLALAAWVIYSPSGQLLALGGACLGPTSNNVAEYRAIIELLWDALSHGITQLEV